MHRSAAKRLLGIFVVLAATFPSNAFAVTRTWYVDTDCANNGDGSVQSPCAASVGAAGPHTTLSNAITQIVATFPNFVTSTTQGFINLKGATVDTSIPDFSGITTAVATPLTLTVDVANRHPGYRDATKYTLKNSRSTAVVLLNSKTVHVNGLQVVSAGTNNAEANMGISTTSLNTFTTITITNNLVVKEGTTTSGGNYGINMNANGEGITNTRFEIGNNFVYGMRGAGVICNTNSAVSCFIYSNTVRNISGGNGRGVDLYRNFVGSVIRAKNNLSYGNSGNDYTLTGTDGTVTTATNVTEDATSPDGVGYVSQTVTFGPQTVDGRLTAVASGATDKGTNLSADADFAFSTDFIGTTRPQGSAWDVGANEMIGNGPNPALAHTLSALGVGN